MVSLRALREANGLSAPQLAERIAEHGVEVDPSSIRNIELGHKGISNVLMTAWARALRLNRVDIWLPEDLEERLLDPADPAEDAA